MKKKMSPDSFFYKSLDNGRRGMIETSKFQAIANLSAFLKKFGGR
jgi:hypothetical protein